MWHGVGSLYIHVDGAGTNMYGNRTGVILSVVDIENREEQTDRTRT